MKEILEIVLTDGQITIINKEDAHLLPSLTGWMPKKRAGKQFHAWHNISRAAQKLPSDQRPPTRLHHFILPRKKGFDVDHINGNGLDNRRENLRYATRTQNNGNRWRVHGISKYKGVCRLLPHRNKTNRFQSYISFEGKRYPLGNYVSEEEAARAYDRAALKYFGEFAKTNFPRDEYEQLPLAA